MFIQIVHRVYRRARGFGYYATLRRRRDAAVSNRAATADSRAERRRKRIETCTNIISNISVNTISRNRPGAARV